jgi:uncharacterized cupin superfamily protein
MPSKVYTANAVDLPRETRFDGQYHRTGIVLDAANLCFVWLDPGAFSAYTDENGLAPGHCHPFDQFVYVIEGKFRIWTGDRDVHDLDAGEFIYIPRDVPHGGMPRDNSPVHLMEVFAPIRTDYLYVAEHQLADREAERRSDGSRVDRRSLFDTVAAMGDSTPARLEQRS